MMLGIVTVALLLMLALTTWALHNTFNEIGRAVIEDDIGEYGVLYSKGGVEGVRSLFTAGTHEHDQLLRIVGPDHEVKLEVLPPEVPKVSWPDWHETPALPAGITQWHQHSLEGGGSVMIGRHLLDDGGWLLFGRTDAQDMAAIHRVQRLIALSLFVAAVLAVGPVFWFANRVLKPVRALIKSAHQLAGDLTLHHRLVTSESIPELREFAHAFNESLDRVQLATEELEAANDQLAHELRTPLARIRGNVGSVLANANDADAVREGAARAIDEVERATSLIQKILSIRAGDSRSMRLQLEIASLQTLVAETCELYSAAAEAKDVDFDLLLTGPDVSNLIDKQRIQQALCNLLDNALAYTPSGGAIEVELVTDLQDVTLHVRDTGPGISDADEQRIWNRFMRGSAASANTPGIGLGLSLVRAVANAHHGEAGVENRPNGGAHFWLRLPQVAKV